MAAGNDTVNIKVKYIPDTSALKNIKEIKMPEIKVGGKDAGKGVFDSYNNAIRDLNRELSKGTDASAITKAFKTVGEETQKVRTQINSMKEAINQSFQSPSNQSLTKDYQNLEKQLRKLDTESQKRRKKSAELSSFKSQNNMSTPQARKEISKAEALVTAGEKLTKQDQERLGIARQIVAKEEELAKLRTQEEIRNAQKDIKNQMSDSKYDSMISSAEANRILGQYNDILSRVGINLNGVTGESKKFSSSLDEQVNQVKAAKKEVVKFGDIISGTFLGTSLSNLFQTGLSRGIEFFKDYDETLTRTMMVTGQTREEVNNLTSSYNRLANQLSSTTKDVAAAQLVFYQQGLGTSEALKMTEASIAISKTGGIESAEAANRLTAAVRGYQLSANEAMDIADKMSALDAAAASSVDELTVAMQKSASQARMAGLDLDYYMAYLSTMQEVTREAPENIGTAMKSITSRLQEIKDIGKIEEDGTTFSNVAKALNSIGIAATDSSGQLRTLQDIMEELGPMWNTLDRNHKAYIATVLAGNRQQSRFIALMDNYDRAMELVNVSQNANGNTAKQLRAYNQGLEASFVRLNNAWQQFATNIADSSMIKRIIDMFSSLIELLNKIPKGITSTVVPLLALTKVFTTLSKAGNLFKGFKTWSIEKLGINIKDISNDMGSFNKIINSGIGLMSKWGNSIKKALDGWGNNVYISDTTKKIEDFTVAEKAATAAQILSDPIQHSEALLNTEIADSAVGAKDAYLAYNQALTDNAVALGFNDTGQRTEIQQNIQKMVDEYNAATVDVKASDEKITALEKKIEKARNRDIDKEVMTASHPQARQYGKEYLYSIRESKDESLTDLMAKHKKKGQRITGDIQKDELNFALDHQNEIANYLKQQNEATIAEMEKSLDELYEHHNQLMSSQLKLKDEVDTQSKKLFNSKEMKRAVSLNQLDTIKKDKNISFANMKTVVSDKNLTNMEKMSAFTSKLNIGAGLVAGSLTKMGAAMVGLGEDEQEGLSNTVGLAVTFGKFAPPWGAIIGASIGLVGYAFDKLTVSAEEARKSLEEINQQQDKLTTKKGSISDALAKYDELKNKLTLTEEEQQELNAAANELAKLIPSAVRGYDDMGNAIISATRAQEELNSLMREQVTLSKKEMKSLNDLQEAEDGWDATRWLIEGLPWNWGNGVTAGEKQAQDRAGVAAEFAADINEYFTVLRDSLNKDMEDTEKEIFNKIAGSFRNALFDKMLSEDPEEQIGVEEAAQKYENLLNSFVNNINTDQLEKSITKLGYVFDFGDYTFGEAADVVRNEVEAMLAGAGYKTEQIEQVVNVVLDMTLEGGGAILQALDTLEDKRKEILSIDFEDRTEQDKKLLLDLDYMEGQIKSLDAETADFAAKLGLLDTSAADFIKSQDGINNIVNGFRDASGEINNTTANLDRLNEAYAKMSELEKKKEKVQNQMKNGELTWSGGRNAKDFVSQERPEWAGIYFSDADYAKAVEDLLEKYKGAGITTEQAEEALSKYGIVLDGQAETLEDLYNKFVVMSDQGEELNAINGELKTMGNYLNIIESAFPEEPSFGKMKETLDSAIQSASTLSDLMQELQEQSNVMSAQNVSTMFGVLDELEGAFENGLVDSSIWSQNMQALADNLKVVNGEMTLTEQGQQALVNLQIESIRATYRAQLADLEATEAKLSNQKAIMTAYLNSLQATLKGIKQEGEQKFNQTNAEEQMATSLGQYLDAQNWAQVESTEASLNEMLKGYQSFFTQIDKMYTQMRNGQKITFGDIKLNQSDVYNKIVDPIKKRYTGLITDSYSQSVKNLEEEIKSVEKVIGGIDAQLAGVKAKKTVAEYMATSKNIGDFLTKGTNKASDAQDNYNERLERTLTLLEKIEGLQHKIDENETFKDLYKDYSGEDYGRLMMTNLDLAQQQYDVYKDLFKMQQEMTNQAAGDLLDSPYGQMFKIQENGDIGWADLTMYDKYKSMPADMKEDIDNLVEAFQKQRDALRDTENDMSKYAQEVKKVREELVQMQIEIENELVDAIKNREKILHDARIKAYDDEIDMIEKAVEARKKAQEDDNSNKELYKAQEALRRATLDSSGKNNAQLLQLQQDLEDKQLEIAEKRFEDDMDDRKQWLQDTKDAETETYEYRLEKMTWYWEQVQAIQEEGTEAMMETLIHWNEEYRQQSALQQSEMEREWKETMDAMKAATDMGAELGKLTSDIVSVTQTVEAMDIKIQALPGSWQKATEAVNAYSRAVQGTGGYGGNIPGGNADKDPGDDEKDKIKVPEPKAESYFGFDDIISAKEKGASPVTIYDAKGKKYTKGIFNFGYKAGSALQNMRVEDIAYAGGQFLYKPYGVPYYIKGLQLEGTTNGVKKKVYKTGGYVDYTGPAWVDGSKSRPEAFLSAYQTEQIGALAKSLDPSTVNNATTNSNVTFGSINFNVASMSSAADGKKALDVFVQGANDMMAKKGIGTKLNINMK